jgi:predicted nucleotidyltransferase
MEPGERVGKKKRAKGKSTWADAKRRCGLSVDDIRMAKELGFSPKSLIRNIPSPTQQWKASVKIWIRDLYLEKVGIGSDGFGFGEEDFPFVDDEVNVSRSPQEKHEEEVRGINRQRREWRKAAKYVSHEFQKLEWVQKVVLFGSVASRSFIGDDCKALPHRPKDIDLAVWISSSSSLRSLHKAKNRALSRLLKAKGIGVASHQVDTFLMNGLSGQFLGGLCLFNACPKDEKLECLVPGCGHHFFLRQFEGFSLRSASIFENDHEVLFQRGED